MSFVPEELVRNATESRGAEGAEWARRLPALVAALERRWALRVGPPFPELSRNWVALAIRADGTAAVLKLCLPQDPEFATGARALELFEGRGIARLLELDPERGAMLLERCEPGWLLDTVEDDEEATTVTAGVLGELWRQVPLDWTSPRAAHRPAVRGAGSRPRSRARMGTLEGGPRRLLVLRGRRRGLGGGAGLRPAPLRDRGLEFTWSLPTTLGCAT